MAWEWLAPSAIGVGAVASFTGARLGAKANRDASAEATAQRELQARRDEWGRRFASALERTASPDVLQRTIAVTMLAALLRSELASPDDRALAREVYFAFTRSTLSLVTQGVDDTVVVEDDEDADERGEPT